ncbi:MAG: methionyl-tRNA formyltransferase [Ahrensia sp.]|nr:methionyl-tRNA formyltransferase [Ahrensia sp.]
MSLRLVFMGTPSFSVPTLHALHDAGHEIIACYTQPPRSAGRRGLDLKPSSIQKAAEALGIPVSTPLSLKGESDQQRFHALNADAAVVIAYGMLLPQAILDAPKHGCYNAHASLLPRWRGAAPIQRAIMAGDEETGVMIMKMDVGLDTGPVALTTRVAIDDNTTAGELHDALAGHAAKLMVDAMAALEVGTLSLVDQPDDGACYADKISKREARIDWNRSAKDVVRHIHGLSPFPGAWCELPLGGKLHRVKVLAAEIVDEASTAVHGTVIGALTIKTQDGAVRLSKVQKAGAKPMSSQEFALGNALALGTVLT